MRNFLIPIVVLFISVSAAGFFAWQDFNSPNDLMEETTVILPRASGFTKSIDVLVENKIIKHPLPVKIISYITGYALYVKAGEYSFPSGVTPKIVMQTLMQGNVVKHKITFAEGLNVREITEILRADKVLEGDIPKNIEEGSLFPETYQYIYGDTRASIIKRMQKKMQQTIDELWEKREDNLPLKDKKQALTLASIVEKETGVPSERARVAAVFINRLKKGMKLQTDPTVAYGIEKATGKSLDRPLIIADLREPTPYNTYEIDGLPPTPIANPSRAAIEATLHPLKTNEVYFVATGNGGHNFASTLEEHNKNVRQYRELMSR